MCTGRESGFSLHDNHTNKRTGIRFWKCRTTYLVSFDDTRWCSVVRRLRESWRMKTAEADSRDKISYIRSTLKSRLWLKRDSDSWRGDLTLNSKAFTCSRKPATLQKREIYKIKSEKSICGIFLLWKYHFAAIRRLTLTHVLIWKIVWFTESANY